MYLETERLIIRSFNKTDVRDVFEYLSDETVMEYIEPIMTYEKVVSFIQNAGIKNELIFAMVLKNINKVIGHLIFHKYTNKNIFEIGWIINKEYWNKGYAMEVSKRVIKHGFGELKIKKIIGETEQNNIKSIKSIKTLEKIGMKKVGKNKDGLIEYEINHIN
jgi:RimJ/RimL family protein N-acetyltransferase